MDIDAKLVEGEVGIARSQRNASDVFPRFSQRERQEIVKLDESQRAGSGDTEAGRERDVAVGGNRRGELNHIGRPPGLPPEKRRRRKRQETAVTVKAGAVGTADAASVEDKAGCAVPEILVNEEEAVGREQKVGVEAVEGTADVKEEVAASGHINDRDRDTAEVRASHHRQIELRRDNDKSNARNRKVVSEGGRRARATEESRPDEPSTEPTITEH